MQRRVVVQAAWDAEAKVWYVQQSDVQGLATEAGSLDALRDRIRMILPELLSDDAENHAEIEFVLIPLFA